MKGWYVLNVYSGYEKRVEDVINEFIREKKFEGILFQIKVPMKDYPEMKNGKRKITKKKIFPGYVLVEMDIDSLNWKEVYVAIKNIRGVTGFIGANKQKKPFPISTDEAKAMLQSMTESKADILIRQKNDFKHGETIKITDGTFNTFTGIIEEVNHEKNKLKVMVGIFGRSTPVELDFSQVEKI